MLFKRAQLEAIARGEVTLAVRRWRRPTVKTGGTLKTSIGVLGIDAVEPVGEGDLTEADARASGFDTRDRLLASLPRGDGTLYRIRFHLQGADPRKALAARATLTAAEVAEIEARLSKMDAARSREPWTLATLRAIAAAPGTPARTLAAKFGRPTQPFKRDVRRLKELGLTESLEIGYRLSPRGAALLEALSGR